MTEDELRAIKEENEKLKATLKSYQDTQGDYDTLQKRIDEQEAATKKLQEENRALVLNKQKEEILKAYPDATTFADMISGPDKQAMETQAKQIAERVAAQKEEARKAKEAELRAAWGSVNLPPTSHVLTEDDLKKTREEAVNKGDLKTAVHAALVNLNRRNRTH